MKDFDIFVSYRRDTGKEIAAWLQSALQNRNYSVFLDVDELSGKFDERLYECIDNADNFLLILSEGALDRCKNEGDWVRREIQYAIEKEKNIIPLVTKEFSWPDTYSKDNTNYFEVTEVFPGIKSYEQVTLYHDYRPAAIDKIIRLAPKKLRYDNVNTDLSLGGNIGENIRFGNLMPRHISNYIFYNWPIIMAIQWVIVLFISFQNGTWRTIDPNQIGLQYSVNITHPLFGDVMFIVWNILPFILVGILYRARINIQKSLKLIYTMDEGKADVSSNLKYNGNSDADKTKSSPFLVRVFSVVCKVIAKSIRVVSLPIKKLDDYVLSLTRYRKDKSKENPSSLVNDNESSDQLTTQKERNWKGFSDRNSFWVRIIESPIVMALTVTLSSYACFLQLKKLPVLHSHGEIYWWDWDISRIAYIVRDIALFFDFIGLAYLLIVIVAMVDVIWKILRSINLRIDISNSDKAIGLSSVGNAVSMFLPFFTVLAMNSVVGTIDHRGHGLQQLVIDHLALGAFTVIYFFLFLAPLWPIQKNLRMKLSNTAERLKLRRLEIDNQCTKLLHSNSLLENNENLSAFQRIQNILNDLVSKEKKIRRLHTWPIRPLTLSIITSLGILPLILFFLIRFVF